MIPTHSLLHYCSVWKTCSVRKTGHLFLDRKIPRNIAPKIKQKTIADGKELILNNNSFQFNRMKYIQTLRTAMGTKMAPTYATLTLAYLVENLYEIIGIKIQQCKIRMYYMMEKIPRWLFPILKMHIRQH